MLRCYNIRVTLTEQCCHAEIKLDDGKLILLTLIMDCMILLFAVIAEVLSARGTYIMSWRLVINFSKGLPFEV